MKYYIWIMISAALLMKSINADGMEWLALPSALSCFIGCFVGFFYLCGIGM